VNSWSDGSKACDRSEDVLKQFSDAADRYNHAARLQRAWHGDSLAIAAI
jgi:hypothetical protein